MEGEQGGGGTLVLWSGTANFFNLTDSIPTSINEYHWMVVGSVQLKNKLHMVNYPRSSTDTLPTLTKLRRHTLSQS